jgi:hypothetical protein
VSRQRQAIQIGNHVDAKRAVQPIHSKRNTLRRIRLGSTRLKRALTRARLIMNVDLNR